MKKTLFFIGLILLIIAYFPIFLHLDRLPLFMYDESRNIINAYEMYESHQFLVTTYHHQPEHWNTKPPLLIWLQVLGFYLFKPSVLAARLPTALAALATVIYLFIFCKKHLNSRLLGFLVGMILITANGYINLHGSRTADYDTLLTLWITLYLTHFWLASETTDARKQRNYLLLGFLFVTLACLTKTIAGLIIAPSLVIYLLLQKKLIPFLRNSFTWIGLGSFLGVFVGYYLLREQFDKGYIESVWANDLGGRFTTILENHKHSFTFYIEALYEERFSYWWRYLGVGALVLWMLPTPKWQRLGTLALLAIVCELAFISFAQTKLIWYDMPIYPFASLLIAMLLRQIFFALRDICAQNFITKHFHHAKYLPYIWIGLLFLTPYISIINCVHNPEKNPDFQAREDKKMAAFIHNNITRTDLSKPEKLVFNGNVPQLYIYLELYKRFHALQWQSLDYPLATQDKVWAYQTDIQQQIEQQYNTQLLVQDENLKCYLIQSRK